MSTSQRVTFVGDNTATATTGHPQVSILTVRKQKEVAKKRRNALVSGKGYRAVGSHRRSITKHSWVHSELAELCKAFMEGYGKKPFSQIAQEIHASFAAELNHIRHHQHRCAYVAAHCEKDEDEEEDDEDYEKPETRCHLPTLSAINLKLLDCLSLWANDKHNYISKPSQMHRDVWNHLMLSEKHRTMIRDMSAAAAAKPEVKEEVQQQQLQQQQQEIWNVHPREFVYESEDAFPPAKRRKLNPDEDDTPTAEPSQPAAATVSLEDTAIFRMDEISSALGEVEENRRRAQIAISACIAEIAEHDEQIAQLLTSLQSTASEIDQHRYAIAIKVAEIRAIVDPAAPAEPSRIDEEDDDSADEQDDEQDQDHRPNMYGEYELDYDSDFDGEPPRGGGGYDHGEECS
jgi:hypothetical protein